MNQNTIRAFFAIDLPTACKEELRQNCTNPEKLHITLQFVRQLPTNKIPELNQSIIEALKTFNAFELQISQSTYMLSSYVVLKLINEKSLIELHDTLGNILLANGIQPETRSFKPHITLSRGHPPQVSILEKPLSFAVNEIVLFQSKPEKGQSTYTSLARFKLKSGN